MTDPEKLNKAIELLKRWLLSDYRFDFEKWVKDVRDFIEDDLDEDFKNEH